MKCGQIIGQLLHKMADSAQFEHTLLVTDTGVDVLTQRRTNNGQPHFMDKK